MGAAQKKTNILFLFPDQHRREWLAYQDAQFAAWQMQRPDLHLPHLTQIMERGVTFLNAITPAPLCAPARACLASGTQYPRCETFGNDNDYPLGKPTVYSALRGGGYHVLGTGKFDLRKKTCDWFARENPHAMGFTNCLDSEGKIDAIIHYKRNGAPAGPYMQFLAEKGYDTQHLADMDGRRRKVAPTPLPDECYSDNWITQNTLDMIADVPVGEPWFMQVNFTGPHDPFDVTQRMRDSVAQRQYELPHRPEGDDDSNGIRQNYAAMIENIDRNIGRILDLLAQRGELENTAIIYASDHGEMLGDHGKYAKCVPYRGSIDIPLIIALPNAVRAGQCEGAMVELQDLTATIAQIAGVELPSAVDSKSLLPLLSGMETQHRSFAYSALATKNDRAFQCVLDDAYKYVQYQDGEVLLFSRTADVWEDENLAVQRPDLVAQYAEKIKEQ